MALLAYPTCRVMLAERRLAIGPRSKKPPYNGYVRSHHFGLTEALRRACRLKETGARLVWIEGSTATVPGKVRRRR